MCRFSLSDCSSLVPEPQARAESRKRLPRDRILPSSAVGGRFRLLEARTRPCKLLRARGCSHAPAFCLRMLSSGAPAGPAAQRRAENGRFGFEFFQLVPFVAVSGHFGGALALSCVGFLCLTALLWYSCGLRSSEASWKQLLLFRILSLIVITGHFRLLEFRTFPCK